jgi:hypothetical protein
MDVTIPTMELLGKGSIEELADKVARGDESEDELG